MTKTPPEENLPLRWESTGDQWWFASPIDFAAANGQFDLVIELLHLDPNLLIKLTSLRRIRRLESLWSSPAAAKNRAKVAKKLLSAAGHLPLFHAGYGGWLLYTAAAAGDAKFSVELLRREPLLAYGEGEYGVTDILYAAARGGDAGVFRAVLERAVRPEGGVVGEEMRWEVVNRAAHAAARGGNVVVLKEVLDGEGGGVEKFVDELGCCLLHSAAGTGQVQVVKYLIENFNDIATRVDNQGNTALHVASNRGFLQVVETLLQSSPSLSAATNNYGETFLHTAIAGFRAPGFRRLDSLISLVKSLLSGEIVDLGAIVNARNSYGRTALHLAVAENADAGLVEILMGSPAIKLNVKDFDGMTPLDLLKRRPRSASSEILIKRMISAGGIANPEDRIVRARIKKALASQVRHGFGATSPGTSFRIPDGEIFLFTGIESSPNQKKKKKSVSVDYSAAKRLNSFLLKWPKKTKADSYDEEGNSPAEKIKKHVPLRQKYSGRVYNDEAPSPSTVKMRFAAGLTHGVIKTKDRRSSGESSSPEIMCDKNACVVRKRRGSSLDEKMMMNGFFSFGAQEAVRTY